MADLNTLDTRRKFTSIDDILQDLECTRKKFRGMQEGHGSLGYYKFSSVVEDLIRQTIDIALQIERHRTVLDDLYEERKWLVAAYKDEAVSNIRIQNACAELQQRLILTDKTHEAGGGFPTQAKQIGQGLTVVVAMVALVTMLTFTVVGCFALMETALDVLRASPEELIVITIGCGVGILVTFWLYARKYVEGVLEG
jgi:hypothetical protein